MGFWGPQDIFAAPLTSEEIKANRDRIIAAERARNQARARAKGSLLQDCVRALERAEDALRTDDKKLALREVTWVREKLEKIA